MLARSNMYGLPVILQIDVTALHGFNLHRLPQGAFSEWPTIHPAETVNATPYSWFYPAPSALVPATSHWVAEFRDRPKPCPTVYLTAEIVFRWGDDLYRA